MNNFRKFVAGLVAAIVGLFFWNGLPDFRPVFAWTIVAAIGCYALALIAQKMIRSLLSDELVHIGQKMDMAADKLELLDRKLTVLVKDALEQRQQR